MTEPVRWMQTNLRETDAALDPVRHAEQLADMRANVALMGMGGICAYYPTRVEFHYPSPYLPAGRDMFGSFLREAHARHIRVVGAMLEGEFEGCYLITQRSAKSSLPLLWEFPGGRRPRRGTA